MLTLACPVRILKMPAITGTATGRRQWPRSLPHLEVIRPPRPHLCPPPPAPLAPLFPSSSCPANDPQALSLDGSRVENEWVDVSLHVMKQASREFRATRENEPPFGSDVPDDRIVVLKGLPFSLLEDEVRLACCSLFACRASQ